MTVNLQSTYRKDEYFRAELTADNSSAPLWFALTNVAVLSNGTDPDIVTTNQGNVLVAKATEAFLHDLDGNLTCDSLWTNTWNGENRLIATESASGVPSGGKAKETWSHLPDGRWIERVVYAWNGSAYVAQSTNRLVWDGQVLLAIVDHTNGLVTSLVRGLDLSGSIQGAGGVGGVLAAYVQTNGAHFYAYDGNGNVSALLSATNGAVTAQYEYSPFGETLRADGVVARANPIRFSTQFADEVTGRRKYLHRELTDAGRWLSRDPLGEFGRIGSDGHATALKSSASLYAFVENRPIDSYDYLGLAKPTKEEGIAQLKAAAEVLKSICRKCTKPVDEKGDKWAPCKPDQCEREAQGIIDAVVRVWTANYGNGSDPSKDEVGGYLCWDWSRAFKEAAEKVGSKAWTITESMAHKKNSPDRTVHFFIILNITGSHAHECVAMIDDGWQDPPNMFHRPPWPPSDKWSHGNWHPSPSQRTMPPMKY